jgi:(p)ppGpp synthase/HD superfamily hydrolase
MSVPSVPFSWAEGEDPVAPNPDRKESRMTLDEALRIAVDAHADQPDKAGKPYILHPLRVMLTVESPSLDSARKVAILHDVVEDSPWTVESLDAKYGLTPEEQVALRLLSHAHDDDYDTYVAKLASNPLAAAVKVADLRDNLDVTRLEEVTERDAKRISKYLRSLRTLTAGGGRREAM